MRIYRPGQRMVYGQSDVQARQFGQVAAPAATPYSLSFTGANNVSVADAPSIRNLQEGAGMGVDLYWQVPDWTPYANFNVYPLIWKGAPTTDGWVVRINTRNRPTIRAHFMRGSAQWASTADFLSTPGNWIWIRGRMDGANLYCSIDAGLEGTAPYTLTYPTTAAMTMQGHGGLAAGVGKICYVHLWNADPGALVAVPASPIAIGANTAARYRFSDGAGGTLTDDSGNGNNGTITGATWNATVPAGWSL